MMDRLKEWELIIKTNLNHQPSPGKDHPLTTYN